jgi:cobalt-zinc-cadmium resistance protein CzcA
VRADVAIKLFGDDLAVLTEKGTEIADLITGLDGAEDVSTEQLTGQPVMQVEVDQTAIARFGIPARSVLDIVESLGGQEHGEVAEGQLRFPLTVRLPERLRRDSESVGSILISAPSGERVPLAKLAHIRVVEGPSTITREWGQRRTTIQANIRGRDVASFVTDAKAAIAKEIQLPEGRYRLEWGGQFENLERAREKLLVVVPVALLLIFLLLYLSFQSVRLALLVFTAVPLAVTGGVAALWLRGMPFSISAAVGFIALSGVAVLNGLVMVTFIRQLRHTGLAVDDAVVSGSLVRLRPVLMTALVAAFGFIPMAIADGMGAEVQRPLATVVIGGVISSTLLTLFVLPVLYKWFEPRGAAEVEEEEASAPSSSQASPSKGSVASAEPPVPVSSTT